MSTSASTETSPLPAKAASDPFALPSADIVIRTSDHVEFRLHKLILSIASPFFNDMFSLKQPPRDASLDTDLEVIPVTETSGTLDSLLRLCYPVVDPSIPGLEDLENVLEASLKYQMTEATIILRDKLRAFIPTHPLQVYAIACRIDIEEEAATAAQAWKAKKGWAENSERFSSTLAGASYIAEMYHISAGDFYRLLQFLRMPTIQPSGWRFTSPPSPLIPGHGSSPDVQCTVPFYDDVPPDIRLRSFEGHEVAAHKQILLMASAKKLFENKCPGEDVVYLVHLPTNTLRELVRLCYPFQSIFKDSKYLYDLSSVVRAATKYGLQDLANRIREHCGKLAHAAPLDTYCLSVILGWHDIAVKAAQSVDGVNMTDLYVSAMEHVPAQAYQALLKFQHERTNSALTILNSLPKVLGKWRTVLGNYNEEFISLRLFLLLPLIERTINPPESPWCYDCRNYDSRRASCARCIPNGITNLIGDIRDVQKQAENAQSKVNLELDLSTVSPNT